MHKFIQRELRKLFEDGTIVESPRFPGTICLGTLGGDLRVRVELACTALQVTVLNRTEGVVDKNTINFVDVLGRKMIADNPNFPNGIAPHFWKYNGKTEWYGYTPTDVDYRKLRQAVSDYLEAFRERETVRDTGDSKLVYICAPLRGDVEKNIEFARQKAQEVFQMGDIPVCPHLMFPPIADPENPEQDQSAREMGLRLVAVCQQVNVYGQNLTDGMLAEIEHAARLGIEVKADQELPQCASPANWRKDSAVHE